MESNPNTSNSGIPTPPISPTPNLNPTPAPVATGGNNKGMSDVVKIGLIFGVLIIIIAGAVYWYISSTPTANISENLSDASADAVAEVLATNTSSSDLADYISPTDPTSSIIEVNPVEAANPFSDLQVNPFE